MPGSEAANGAPAIAIIGVGCRFPDADDPAALLDLVLTGRRAFRRLPPSRLELADYFSADRATPDATYSARAALLEGWEFDLAAFGVPAALYQAADPTHWLALETAARALAAAGFAQGRGLARNRTGVIIGNTLTGDGSRAAALRLRWPYVRRVLAESLAAGGVPRERAMPVLRHAAQRYLEPFPAVTDETLAGSMPAAIASRICGYFGFRGGGYAVDGSHASSLLAVVSACSALAAGELDVALAGGVDLSLDPLELVGLAKTGALARGDMRVYDESPTGFLPGEGCGMVVLMRAADARLAGLPVYAEIAGWGTSSAGQASLAVPDAHSQFLALRRAYERARIAPGDVQLIEGHGAGTAAADATELSALAELRAGARQVAALGSIKANIGNTKAAAGAAGLIKTVLAMSTGIIPPATGFSRPHPLVRGGGAALRLPRAPEPWPDGTRIAGVSSMGPGLNIHVVLRGEPSRGRHERKHRMAAPPPRTAAGPAVGYAAESAGSAPPAHTPPANALAAAASAPAPSTHPASTSPEAEHAAATAAPAPTAALDTSATPDTTTAGAATAAPDTATTQAITNPSSGPADHEETDARTDVILAGQSGPAIPAERTDAAGRARTAPATKAAATRASAAKRTSGATQTSEASRATEATPATLGGPPRPTAYLLHAPDRDAMDALLARVAHVAPWLSDAEFGDLACQLAHDAAQQGRVRLAILASRQDQLARLATQAAAVLPMLNDGGLITRPGIFAADGADGQVTLLISEPDAPGSPFRPLSALRWLDQLGLHAAAGVGFGHSELAGLVWAGCLSEAAAAALAGRRAEIRSASAVPDAGHQAGQAGRPAADDDRAAQIREAVRRLTVAGPRRRLISATLGREITSSDDVAELLCADLDCPTGLEHALHAGTADASLLLETGPGEVLIEAASVLCEIPGVSLGAGSAADAARAAAALFAVGALAQPSRFFAGTPWRPMDLWRDRTFITNPCQARPSAAAPRAASLPRPATPPAAPPLGAGVASTGLSGEIPPVAPLTQAAATARRAVEAGRAAANAESAAAADGTPAPAPAADAEPAAHQQSLATDQTTAADGAAEDQRPATIEAGADTEQTTETGPTAEAGPSAADQPTAEPEAAAPAGLAEADQQTSRHRPRPSDVTVAPDTQARGTRARGTQTRGTRARGSQTRGTQARGTGVPGEPGGEVPDALAFAAAPTFSVPEEGDQAPVTGVGPWVRCFTEARRPVADDAAPAGDDGPWRVRAATSKTFGPLVRELFRDDPAAGRALAVVGDAANPDACAVALAAARDAIGCGQLVLITHGAGFSGFCASLHAEHPELGITVLRVPESADGLRAARRFAAAEPGRFRELVIDTAASPHEAVMAPVETPGAGDFPLGPEDVVLVSRGSGGSGLALAQVLACCGAAVALIGRATPGEADDVETGLERLRSAGVRVSIDDVDVANPADLRFALQQIEQNLGPVTAVAHAVGPGRRVPVAELTEEELRAHILAETATLNDLVSAHMTRQIRLIVTFGSVVGRYGLAGEGMLALTSAALAERAVQMSDGIAGCRSVHVDWPAWSGPGLGQRASLVGGLSRAGAAALPVREGSRLLLKALATPDLPASVALHGRVGVPEPAAIAAETPAGTAPGRRFLEHVRLHYPGVEFVCEARLSLPTDPYLGDHRVDGMPVLPAAMALEAMAEAAEALAGRPLRHLTDVSMDAPVVIPGDADDARAVIRICALADGGSVTVVLQSEDSGFATDHFRATFRSVDETAVAAAPSLAAGMPDLDEMAASDIGIVDGTELYGSICYQSGRFRRAALLPEVTSRSCRALVRGGDGPPWFGGAPWFESPDGEETGLTLGSPGLNDASWHVLQACVPHRRLLPAGCEAVTFSGREADGAVEIRAVEFREKLPRGAVPGPRPAVPAPAPPDTRVAAVPAQGGAHAARAAAPADEYIWDVEAVDAAGRSLVTWRGLRLRDAGPLPRQTAWPPSLLSVYLERSAVALGLHPELRVSVRCGQPEGAGAPPAAVVPRPSPAPDHAPAGPGPAQTAPENAPAGPDHPQIAPGRGELEGFALSVRTPEAAACGWAAATPGSAAESWPGLGGLEDEVRRLLNEPPAVLSARLRAVAACLARAGEPPVSEIATDGVVTDGTGESGWLVLTVADGTLACTVVEISGVSSPVAIAIMTPDAARRPKRGTAPGRRAHRHRAARS